MRKKHFLIQTVNGNIEYDFQQTLLNHFRWNKSLSEDYTYSLFEWDGDIQNIPTHKDTIPVGTVEFLSAYLNIGYGIHLKPINIPYKLSSFAGREFGNTTIIEDIGKVEDGLVISSNGKRHDKFFWKSADKMKAGYGIAKNLSEIPKNINNVFLSEIVDILSEWRVFVHRNKIIDVKNYSGDFWETPSKKVVEEMVKAYQFDCPVSYTLDVAVINKKSIAETCVIEVHPILSCGLYGFDDLKYPYMLSQTFFEIVKNKK